MKDLTHIIEKYLPDRQDEGIFGIFKGDDKNKSQSIIPKTARKLAMKYHSASNDTERLNVIAGLILLACGMIGTSQEQQALSGLAIKIAGEKDKE